MASSRTITQAKRLGILHSVTGVQGLDSDVGAGIKQEELKVPQRVQADYKLTSGCSFRRHSSFGSAEDLIISFTCFMIEADDYLIRQPSERARHRPPELTCPEKSSTNITSPLSHESSEDPP